MDAFSRRVASWLSWDCYQPVRHVITGPVFEETNTSWCIQATQEFSKMLSKALRDYPEWNGK
jgi:hypothetical protein